MLLSYKSDTFLIVELRQEFCPGSCGRERFSPQRNRHCHKEASCPPACQSARSSRKGVWRVLAHEQGEDL